jgi:hypothetical protein
MRSLSLLKRRAANFFFERRWGLSTSEPLGREALGYDEEQYPYEPSGWQTLGRALPRAEVGPHDVFADLGSGKGRIVFQAAKDYAFGRVIGVELSPELHEVARANIERGRRRLRCKNVELVNADVLSWRIPDDLTIVYLHNPFRGELFSAAVRRLVEHAERTGRPIRLLYVNPVDHDRLMATGAVRELSAPTAPNRPTHRSIRIYEVLPAERRRAD